MKKRIWKLLSCILTVFLLAGCAGTDESTTPFEPQLQIVPKKSLPEIKLPEITAPEETTVPEETTAESGNVTLYVTSSSEQEVYSLLDFLKSGNNVYEYTAEYPKKAYIKGDLGDRINETWKEVYEEYKTTGQYEEARINALIKEVRNLLKDKTILQDGVCVFLNENGKPVLRVSSATYVETNRSFCMAEYNIDGKLSKITHWRPEFAGGLMILYGEKSFTYNEDGYLTSANVDVIDVINYMYDTDYNLTQVEILDKFGTKSEKITYKFNHDSLGNIVEVQEYRNDKLSDTREHAYTEFEITREQAAFFSALYDLEVYCGLVVSEISFMYAPLYNIVD